MSWGQWTAILLLWAASLVAVWRFRGYGSQPSSQGDARKPRLVRDDDASATAAPDPRPLVVRLDELNQRLAVLSTALEELREDTNVRFLKREKRDQRERRDSSPAVTDPDAEELPGNDLRQLDFLRPQGTPPAHSGRPGVPRGRLIRR